MIRRFLDQPVDQTEYDAALRLTQDQLGMKRKRKQAEEPGGGKRARRGWRGDAVLLVAHGQG